MYKINELSSFQSRILASVCTRRKHSQQCAATFQTQAHSLKIQATTSRMLVGNVANQDHLGSKGMYAFSF